MHRERGLLLDEPEVTVDGNPIPASILGTALTLFYAGRAQAERGQGIYFYLPKMEAAAEASFWKEFFAASQERLDFLKNAVIRAIPLIESLPAAYQMEEILFALGPYGAGLNAARWDFQASILEFVMTDPAAVWPDRFGVDIKSTEFLATIFRRLVAVCLKRGTPFRSAAWPQRSRARMKRSIRRRPQLSGRTRSGRRGRGSYGGGWRISSICRPRQNRLRRSRPRAGSRLRRWQNPDHYPFLTLQVPAGLITLEGTRRNARMLLEYLEGWLNGRGAKGIDTLAGKPGTHPALMEDLATRGSRWRRPRSASGTGLEMPLQVRPTILSW